MRAQYDPILLSWLFVHLPGKSRAHVFRGEGIFPAKCLDEPETTSLVLKLNTRIHSSQLNKIITPSTVYKCIALSRLYTVQEYISVGYTAPSTLHQHTALGIFSADCRPSYTSNSRCRGKCQNCSQTHVSLTPSSCRHDAVCWLFTPVNHLTHSLGSVAGLLSTSSKDKVADHHLHFLPPWLSLVQDPCGRAQD